MLEERRDEQDQGRPEPPAEATAEQGGGEARGPVVKPFQADYTHVKKIQDYAANGAGESTLEFDGTYLVDKLTDVYNSGTMHEEQQPAHLKIVDTEICATTCKEEYGNPCQHFCPAAVYEWLPGDEPGAQDFQINFSNCVHCKTCDIMDPYQIIDWVTPEGGGGPNFARM